MRTEPRWLVPPTTRIMLVRPVSAVQVTRLDQRVDRGVHVAVAAVEWFQIEARCSCLVFDDGEDDDASHAVLGPVVAGAIHCPLGPHSVVTAGLRDHLGAEVRDGGEDGFPVATHLILGQ